MNLLSRTSILFLAAFVAGCAAERDILLVSSDNYASETCWLDTEGRFEAFLTLGIDGSLAVPYFVSTKCLVDGDYSSFGEATIHHLNTIEMADSRDILQKSFKELKVSDNIRTDLPLPSSNSKLYYFKALIIKDSSLGRPVYVPVDILKLKDMNMTFESFLELSKDQRKKLLNVLN